MRRGRGGGAALTWTSFGSSAFLLPLTLCSQLADEFQEWQVKGFGNCQMKAKWWLCQFCADSCSELKPTERARDMPWMKGSLSARKSFPSDTYFKPAETCTMLHRRDSTHVMTWWCMSYLSLLSCLHGMVFGDFPMLAQNSASPVSGSGFLVF